MNIRIEMLRVLQVVAETGTLSAAASRLGRTPSAISMMLSQLESEIGAPLFEGDRKNRLSDLGRMVLDESMLATSALDRATAAIHRHARSRAGTVRIAAVPSATLTLLPPVIEAFRADRPQVRLEITDTDSAMVRRAVTRGEADIGILSGPPGNRPPADGAGNRNGSSLEEHVILGDELGIAASNSGAIARLAAMPEAIPSWDWLALEPLVANPLCDLVESPLVRDLVSASNLEARNTSALISFAARGIGATVLPASVMDGLAKELCFIIPQDPIANRELRMVRQSHNGSSRRPSPVAIAFWELLAGMRAQASRPSLPTGKFRG